MPPPLKKSATTPLTVSNVSIDGSIPVTALSAAGGSSVFLDNFITESTIRLPADCKWVSFSANTDFMVGYRNQHIVSGFPGNLSQMFGPGNTPVPDDPDNFNGPGDPASILIECNPGLRDVSAFTNIVIKGLGDGILTVMYYSES